MTQALADQAEIDLGVARLRPSSCEVHVDGRDHVLEPQVMRALLVLARSQGKVVSRAALVDAAWDGRAVSEDAINRVISRLRKLAVETGAFTLTTQRKVGYRLTAVEAVSALAYEPAIAQPPPLRRRYAWPGLLAVVALLIASLAVWRLLPPRAPEIASLTVVALRPATPDLAPDAARLTADLTTTLSRMKGLRVESEGAQARPGDKPALLLGGVLSPAEPGLSSQPAVALNLTDRRSGARVWSAAFDARGVVDPTVRERALSAVARYVAIWLGDRVQGVPAAREPVSPEITRLVAEARQTLSAAHRARHNRDWATFTRLERETRAVQAKVLAMDPDAAPGLMLGYQVEAVPEFQRPDETAQAYDERQRRAARFLAQAIAADPDDTEALAATARDFRRALRWEEADKLLERAVAIDPNSPDANTWYAYGLALSGRCEAALRHARIAAGLLPGDDWRAMAVPRMQHCAGRTAVAAADYRKLLDRSPGNVFVLHDLYLMRLGAADAAGLRADADEAVQRRWRGQPPPAVASLAERMRQAADALDGRPAAFLAVLAREDREIGGPEAFVGSGAVKFGSTWGDQAFMLAFEYAAAGRADRALVLLRQAVNAGSLYLPWALPYGAHEFPPAVRDDPAYAAIWRSSPGLAALIERRRASRRNGLGGL